MVTLLKVVDSIYGCPGDIPVMGKLWGPRHVVVNVAMNNYWHHYHCHIHTDDMGGLPQDCAEIRALSCHDAKCVITDGTGCHWQHDYLVFSVAPLSLASVCQQWKNHCPVLMHRYHWSEKTETWLTQHNRVTISCETEKILGSREKSPKLLEIWRGCCGVCQIQKLRDHLDTKDRRFQTLPDLILKL